MFIFNQKTTDKSEVNCYISNITVNMALGTEKDIFGYEGWVYYSDIKVKYKSFKLFVSA
jgi:hypothetical protein